jgi:glycosyltransferase involved in cell wall biosynthesis
MPMPRVVVNVFFNAFWSLSGSDRILVECSKRWTSAGAAINVFTVERGYEFCKSYDLADVHYDVLLSSKVDRFGFLVSYVARIMRGCSKAMFAKFSFNKEDTILVYSSSDFWPDSLPAWIMKMRFKNVRWIAGFYLFAPTPFSKDSPYKGGHFAKGLFYYLSQIPVYHLVKKCASMVWVTSEPDRLRFIGTGQLKSKTVIAVRGGVDTKTPDSIPDPVKKQFDAVFVGRFHPQKGVLELIDIWRYVCNRKKDAMLALIGIGELEGVVREKIHKLNLDDNVVLLGFKDGVEKIEIFKNSKVVIHPALYDSGGMAACEAMACGLPGVSFDLPALKTYYPKGMLKTPCYDLKAFSENIFKLLTDETLYRKTAKDALDWAKEWDWDQLAEELLNNLKKLGGY